MSTTSKVRELLNRRNDLKNELRGLEHELIKCVETYQGSIIDAVADGLVRFNFAINPGYRKFLIENRRSN